MAARDLSVKLIINGEDRSAAALAKSRAGLESLGKTIDGIKNSLNSFLAIGVGSIITQQIGAVVKTADAYKTLEARLKLVSDNTAEFANAQKQLFDIANRTRSGVEATTTVYGRLETVIKQLGGTQKDALKTTETLNQAIALTSQGMAQDAAAIQQFSQALSSGVLRGDEFNSVMENSPGLAQALADGLDVPITKLRGMAEQGELTADRLVNALGKSAPQVAAQFAQLPVTVGGAFTVLSNKFTQFIGENDKATGASAALAKGILALGNNLDKVITIGEDFAALYGVKIVASLAKNLQGYVLAAKAARDKAAADQQAKAAALSVLQTDTALANIRVKSLQATIAAKREELALADTKAKSAQITRQIEAAEKKLATARSQQAVTQQKLNTALYDINNTATTSVSVFNKLGQVLRGAFTGKIIADVFSGILGVLGESNEKIRIFSFAWQAAIDKVMAATGYFLSGDFLQGRAGLDEKLAEIDRKYGDLAVASTDSAQKVQQAETVKTAAIEQAAVQQAASFDKVKQATTQLTTQIDADAKAQTASIQTALTERLAAIDASNASDISKDAQRLEANTLAAQQELQLQTQTATAKIALIDQEYAKEIAASQANKERTAQLESEKRQAKLGVYTGLADYYQGEVNRLQQVYANEYQLAANAKQNLQALEQNHRQALADIDRLGLDEKKRIESEKSEFDDNIRKITAEKQKGQQADQGKINDLLDRNKQLHQDITNAAITQAETESQKDSARYDAKDRLNKLYAFEKTALEDNVKAHEANAAAAAKSLDGTKEKLDALNGVIGSITDLLKNELLVKVGLDDAALNAAQAAINELIKPAEKVITIRTVGGNTNNPFSPPIGGGPDGGTAGAGVGGFSTGGFLPGYGGGDQVPALLERGEFVIPKEQVKHLGVGFMEAIRSGKIKRYARGGLVDDDLLRRLAEIKNQQDIARLTKGLNQADLFSSTNINTGDKSDVGRQNFIARKVFEQARLLGRQDLIPGLQRIIDNTVSGKGKAGDTQARLSLRGQLFGELGKDTGSGLQIPTPNLSPLAAAPGGISGPTITKATEIKFTGKDGSSVTGQFSGADDHNKLLKILRDAGGVTV
jgi:tape measure domain-containing protein